MFKLQLGYNNLYEKIFVVRSQPLK